MEATAKGTLMDCEGCSELLADFLLDELPESEAVLVHEHLMICPNCMKAYRELKGTGKALDAVPAMAAVQSSDAFKSDVRKNARIEADKIVSKLPPDRRLRLEARREARHSIRLAHRPPPPKVWSPALLFLALAAALVLVAILLWPKTDNHPPRAPIGTLSVTMGKVVQFFKEENKLYTPVENGKPVSPGENFITDEPSRARFDLNDGGSIFLGPASDMTFRLASEGSEFGLRLENGELGVLRPDAPAGSSAKARDWEIRTPAAQVTIPSSSASTHAYIRVLKGEKASTLDVSVLTGAVKVSTHDGRASEPVHAGQRTAVSSTDTSITVESLSDERPPAWRADVLTDADLGVLLSGKAKVVSRKPGQIRVEISYNRETNNRDWIADVGSATFAERGGALSSPNVRLKHEALLSPPLTYELKLNTESRRDTSFAFGAFWGQGYEVAADLSRDAVLSVYEKNKPPRRDRTPARVQPGAAETLLLQVKPEGAGYVAILNTSGGKTKTMPLWKEKPDAPSEIWFHALGEGILLDEIKLSGNLPVEWIRKKMSGAPDE